MFKAITPFPGITHITDAMGVSFTLIEGTDRALLFDTGYGMEDVQAYVSTLTDMPLKVLLSHGHHDHMLGARWFDRTYLCREDMEEFSVRTGAFQRTKVMKQAAERGVPVPADFMDAPIAMPEEIRFEEKAGRFDCLTESLGGLDVLVIHIPGHTPGSIILFIPACGLLLTGDDWNPCTWMWFPSSLAADQWRENMTDAVSALEAEIGVNVDSVLCSHQPMVRDGEELKTFLAYMTDERLKNAPAVDMGAPINTHRITDETRGWTLVFDRDKI